MVQGAWVPTELDSEMVSVELPERRMISKPTTSAASNPMMMTDHAIGERPSLDDASPVGEQAFSVQAHPTPLGPI